MMTKADAKEAAEADRMASIREVHDMPEPVGMAEGLVADLAAGEIREYDTLTTVDEIVDWVVAEVVEAIEATNAPRDVVAEEVERAEYDDRAEIRAAVEARKDELVG